MTIKHLPSGLFPHFDSGLERRPYYVKAGDCVCFGCRLDGSNADDVKMEVTDSRGSRWILGECRSTNDRGQRYFHFEMRIAPDAPSFCYRFVTSEGETSQSYSCPVLRELMLCPAVKQQAGTTYMDYRTDKQAYSLEIVSAEGIRLLFKHNLTDKIVEKSRNIEDNVEKITVRDDSGKELFRIGTALRIMVDSGGRAYNFRLSLELSGRAVFGLGEKFDAVNQLGRKPLNYVVEQFSNQQDKTYAPIPFLFTDGGVSFLQKTTFPSSFDFSKDPECGWVPLELFAACPGEGTLYEAAIHTGTPEALLKAYARETGRPMLPPKWAFGPWMSSNGWNTQAEALEQIEKMRETAIPATVMVLEAWSDEETFYIWNDAQYVPRKGGGPLHYADFTFPQDGKWPNPKAFCKTLADNGVKLVLWQIPVIKYEAAPHGEQLDLDWTYARENGLCLKNADGTPYQITEMWFGNSMIPDFTNPETRRWWKDCRRYLVEELGVSGFKTDGGEFLFDPDASFFDGRTVAEAHNDFPNIYEETYHELLSGHDGVTFSRAGYTGAQRYPIHWAGDQVSTFPELRGQLTAGLSAGLSGIPFWGFDIGGFAGDFPTTELYLRSAAMAAFAPVMQFHSEPRGGQYYMVQRNHWNNDRSPWNMEIANSDKGIVPVYRLFANLRMNLLPYIWREAANCAAECRPLMAHLVYDYCGDAEVLEIGDEYLFGRDLLVAPVIEQGAQGRQVYLPEGQWFDFWSGAEFDGGRKAWRECPLNRIPIFVRSGAAIPVNLNSGLCMGSETGEGAVSNRLDGYEEFCFLLYGANGQCDFADEFGNSFTLRWSEESETLEGTAVCPVTLFRMDGRDRGSVCGNLFGRTVHGTGKG